MTEAATAAASSRSEDRLSPRARYVMLFTAIGALLFDGVELGLMPVASLSVSQSLLGDAFTPALGGDWFARFTAALMLGAAAGGILLGSLGDRIGRTRALGVSVLFYSVFAGLGAFVKTQEQMLALRFLVGLGVGGVWPNAVALAAECWPEKSRPIIAGLLGAGLNGGILLLSQIARTWHLTPDSWRWLFQLAAAPALLGALALTVVPESPLWLASRRARRQEGPGSGPRLGARSSARSVAVVEHPPAATGKLHSAGAGPADKAAPHSPLHDLFFGWLPLYLPELFPTRVRAAGSGIAYNVGRFATGLGVLAAGALFTALGGSYPKVGAICGLIYLLGLIVIWWAPDTAGKTLAD